MTPKETVSRFFQEGYTNRNFDFVMECMSEITSTTALPGQEATQMPWVS